MTTLDNKNKQSAELLNEAQLLDIRRLAGLPTPKTAYEELIEDEEDPVTKGYLQAMHENFVLPMRERMSMLAEADITDDEYKAMSQWLADNKKIWASMPSPEKSKPVSGFMAKAKKAIGAVKDPEARKKMMAVAKQAVKSPEMQQIAMAGLAGAAGVAAHALTGGGAMVTGGAVGGLMGFVRAKMQGADLKTAGKAALKGAAMGAVSGGIGGIAGSMMSAGVDAAHSATSKVVNRPEDFGGQVQRGATSSTADFAGDNQQPKTRTRYVNGGGFDDGDSSSAPPAKKGGDVTSGFSDDVDKAIADKKRRYGLGGGSTSTASTTDQSSSHQSVRPAAGGGYDDTGDSMVDRERTELFSKRDQMNDMAAKMGLKGSNHNATFVGGVPTTIDGHKVPADMYSDEQKNLIKAGQQMRDQSMAAADEIKKHQANQQADMAKLRKSAGIADFEESLSSIAIDILTEASIADFVKDMKGQGYSDDMIKAALTAFKKPTDELTAPVDGEKPADDAGAAAGAAAGVAGAAAGAAAGAPAAKTQGAAALIDAWKAAGSPMEKDALSKFLVGQGIPQANVDAYVTKIQQKYGAAAGGAAAPAAPAAGGAAPAAGGAAAPAAGGAAPAAGGAAAPAAGKAAAPAAAGGAAAPAAGKAAAPAAAGGAAPTVKTGDPKLDAKVNELVKTKGKDAAIKYLKGLKAQRTTAANDPYEQFKGELRKLAGIPGTKELPADKATKFKAEVASDLKKMAMGDKDSGAYAANKIMQYAKAGYNVSDQINKWLANSKAGERPVKESNDYGFLTANDYLDLTKILKEHGFDWKDIGLNIQLSESVKNGVFISRTV